MNEHAIRPDPRSHSARCSVFVVSLDDHKHMAISKVEWKVDEEEDNLGFLGFLGCPGKEVWMNG